MERKIKSLQVPPARVFLKVLTLVLSLATSSFFGASLSLAQEIAPLDSVDQTLEADYVTDRDDPSVEDLLLEYSANHPEKVFEHERQTTDSVETVESLPAPRPDVVEGKMRSDILPLPDDIDPFHANEIEIQEARDSIRSTGFNTNATGCQTMWPTGFQVCGAILEAYRQTGGQLSWLGPPKTNELTNPDGVGKRSEFYGGSIYWHPSTGAHAVTLDGMRQWGTLGWEAGPLGYPTSSPIDTKIPLTQMQHFQGGDNYYNPLTGGAVWGDIKQRYDQIGGSNHPIGIPISNEIKNGQDYRYNNFSNGTISWRSDRQTRFMFLATQRVWSALGRETGQLGFPSSDELPEDPGIFHLVPFDNRGVIAWSAAFGARELTGQLYNYWHSVRGAGNDLGIPLPALIKGSDSTTQDFTNGIIFGSGDGLGVIYRDTPIFSWEDLGLVEGETPLRAVSTMNESQILPRASQINSGSLVTPAGKILWKTNWPNGTQGTRYIVRQGFYETYSNGNDQGWGYEKITKKHNLHNIELIGEHIAAKDSTTRGGTEPGNFKYAGWVYFLDCRSYSFEKRQGCRNMKDPVWITSIYRPIPMNTYKNRPAKDPSIGSDQWPVGLVTAWCSSSEGAERTETRGSRCPDYVNLYNRLRY
ncbi:uncharacterized protein with LGFP repeats [Corynebacterium afermentans]